MRFRILAWVLWLGACSSSLPSAEPLGSGPLADRGDAGEVAKKAGASDGGTASLADAAAPPAPAAVTKPSTQDAAADVAASVAEKPDTGDAGPSAQSAAGFDGEYLGWDTETARFPSKPEATQRDPKARTRVQKGAGDAIDITLVNSLTGQDICTLKGKLKASDVTLDKGQSCFGETLRSGSAKFSGKKLSLDAVFDAEDDDGEKGEIIYHFEGTKK